MKNPLFYSKSGSFNRFRIAQAKKKLTLCLALIFIFSAVFAASFAGASTASKVKGAAVYAIIVAFPAGVKGTKALHGHDETDEEFTARKGKAETDEAYLLRQMKGMVDEAYLRFDETNKPAIKQIQDSIEALTKTYNKEGFEALKKAMREQGLVIESLKEGIRVSSNRHKSPREQFGQFLDEKKDEIAKIYKNRNGVLEFKNAATMSDSSAAVPEGIPTIQGIQVAPPTNVNLRASMIDRFVNKFATSLSSYAYTESVPKDGDYAFLAEAATKTLIDWKIETRYAPAKKIAAYQLLTEESVTDIPGLQSIAYDYLRRKHDLKRANKILFGTGTILNVGDEIAGAVTAYSVTWATANAAAVAALANQVITPNFFDIVNAAVTVIATTHNYTDEMPYEANICMINPADFYIQLVSAKTSFGTPLYPQASLFNQVTIGNCTVIADSYIPAGKIFVADMSRYNVSDYIPYSVRIGWINDNFITNQFVILGESRMHGFVKNLDRVAFIYDDIATIKAAIAGNTP